eukprot:scaffold648899_cov53-Prasinocladus_malaysianus.AAC.1
MNLAEPLDEGRRNSLQVCVDHDLATHMHYLPVALAAGFKAGATHISRLDCVYIPECHALLGNRST